MTPKQRKVQMLAMVEKEDKLSKFRIQQNTINGRMRIPSQAWIASKWLSANITPNAEQNTYMYIIPDKVSEGQ